MTMIDDPAKRHAFSGVQWRRLLLGFTVLCGVMLGGCSLGSGSSRSEVGASKHGDGVVRTDLEPLTKRWPSLTIESAQWMSGTLGDDRAPGPTSYWIDAVLVVSDSEMSRITNDYDLEPVDAPTDIEPELQDLVPADPVGSAALNISLGAEASGQVFVYPDADTLVVLARFGN